MRFCGGSGQRCGECGNLSEMGFVEGGAIVNKTESLFLLGVGAQKAGTTWLFDYLASSRQAVKASHVRHHPSLRRPQSSDPALHPTRI